MEQWQYEVTGAGRIWYLVDAVNSTCGCGMPASTPESHRVNVSSVAGTVSIDGGIHR